MHDSCLQSTGRAGNLSSSPNVIIWYERSAELSQSDFLTHSNRPVWLVGCSQLIDCTKIYVWSSKWRFTLCTRQFRTTMASKVAWVEQVRLQYRGLSRPLSSAAFSIRPVYLQWRHHAVKNFGTYCIRYFQAQCQWCTQKIRLQH
jgi:hypothetical protein